MYDLERDPGEKHNVITDHPDIVKKLRAAYDDWWQSVLPKLENENAVGPKENPFKELYFRQFGHANDAAR